MRRRKKPFEKHLIFTRLFTRDIYGLKTPVLSQETISNQTQQKPVFRKKISCTNRHALANR